MLLPHKNIHDLQDPPGVLVRTGTELLALPAGDVAVVASKVAHEARRQAAGGDCDRPTWT